MECLVEYIRVPCSNATYGCDARPAYYTTRAITAGCARMLRYAARAWAAASSARSRRSEATSPARRMAGLPPPRSEPARSSSSPSTTASTSSSLAPPPQTPPAASTMFLLNVTRRPEGRGITMHFIGRKQPTERLNCWLWYERDLYGESRKRLGCHHLQTEINFECTEDLSSGLPNPDDRIQFIVPPDDKEGAIQVRVQISIKVLA
ncbi:hypothetical protein SEVIR_3G037000v4 [Setaria viridis]|uniref:Uncharacterized protein n=1 Tax=Setaria viridis TaxID=4556 RepID=A0A4U6VAY1_SETVI|nr:hypothetical protein SEVIR_3G037000v2 [Setaria viridis]